MKLLSLHQKYVDVLKAIRWVAESWDAVKKETIINCVRKSGVIGSVVGHSCEDHDPFDDVDAQEELDTLVCPLAASCPVDEYINGDNDVAICVQYDEDCEEQLFRVWLHLFLSSHVIKKSLRKMNNLIWTHLLQKEEDIKMLYVHSKMFVHSLTARVLRRNNQDSFIHRHSSVTSF